MSSPVPTDATIVPAIDTALDCPFRLRKTNLSDIALTVLGKRYLVKDDDGEVTEEPEKMFWRIASVIAQQDMLLDRFDNNNSLLIPTPAIYDLALQFYDMMAMGLFVPNSPTLMNAGRPLGQLSACFVLPVADSLANGQDGIYDTLKAMARVHQSGGGTGFSFSNLRPTGDIVKSTMGVASGPVSFMSLYDASTDVVKQGGTRRGANMGIMRVDHPDIREFIGCKSDTSKITNFNISVAITNDFMEAEKKDEDYWLISPRDGSRVRKESAREIFDLIVEGAWRTGEPGVFFIDAANRYNPVPHMGAYEATNPCGEQPLLPYDVCNLGSIDVGKFVNGDGEVDWNGLGRIVKLSVHFLDNVITANKYPLPEITDLSERIRRIGLGIMGFADYLVRSGIRYDSQEGLDAANKLMSFVNLRARHASEELADTRGKFPEWGKSIWGPGETCAKDKDGRRIRPMQLLRNCNITTIAPTGTISMIAGCSSGIEPLFAIAFMRNQAGSKMLDVNKDFVHYAQKEGWYSEELMERIAKDGHIHFDEVPEHIQDIFRTAHDISPEWHVWMQGAFQGHVDSAISKTTNFPHEATVEHVRDIYMLAYDNNCKGVTVYRDGSRPEQVLSTGKTQREGDTDQDVMVSLEKRKRPTSLRGVTMRKMSPLGDMYVTINEDDNGNPFEVFCTVGKAGGAAMADTEAIGRLISLSLRSGIPMNAVHKQLRGISCDTAVGMGTKKVLSAPDAIAQVIEEYLSDNDSKTEEVSNGNGHLLLTCDSCGAGTMAFKEGCATCHACGQSRCS